MRFAPYLAAGVVISLAVHASGSAFFAENPDEIEIAASQGGGVAVIGSIEDLVAGVEAETVSQEEPLEEIEEDAERVEPVKVQPIRPAVPVATEVTPEAAASVIAGVTSTERVNAAGLEEAPAPEETPAPEAPAPPLAEVKPVEAAKPVTREVVPQAAPVEKVEPVVPEADVAEVDTDPLLEVTQVPAAKPEPPARKAEPQKMARTDVKKLRKGAEASSRRGGERVTSQSASSNANGRADARTNDGGTRAASNYKGKVAAKLRRAKRYPRDARRQRLEGTVRVSFTISANGSVSGIRVVTSSGHQVLDQAALEMVRRASPMPKFPKDVRDASMLLHVPVEFNP